MLPRRLGTYLEQVLLRFSEPYGGGDGGGVGGDLDRVKPELLVESMFETEMEKGKAKDLRKLLGCGKGLH